MPPGAEILRGQFGAPKGYYHKRKKFSALTRGKLPTLFYNNDDLRWKNDFDGDNNDFNYDGDDCFDDNYYDYDNESGNGNDDEHGHG